MKTSPAYWDASALVPLCVHEASSPYTRTLLRKFAPVVWWGSLVEVFSAICRLRRANDISEAEKQGAVARLRLLSQGWREILPNDQVRDLATHCIDRYPLRAAEGVQLAAALVWCAQRPARRQFICADQRLVLAAKSAGFSVLELLTLP